jgi:hypothetical protein
VTVEELYFSLTEIVPGDMLAKFCWYRQTGDVVPTTKGIGFIHRDLDPNFFLALGDRIRFGENA